MKLAPSPTRSLLPSQFYLLCRFSQKLHSTSRFAHLCLARRSLGEGGSLASPTAPFASGRSDNGYFYLKRTLSHSWHCKISRTPLRLQMNPPENSVAFGAPGIEPRWTSSAKEGVGTAYHTSCRVWFMLSHGIVNEIYYPEVDPQSARDSLAVFNSLPVFQR